MFTKCMQILTSLREDAKHLNMYKKCLKLESDPGIPLKGSTNPEIIKFYDFAFLKIYIFIFVIVVKYTQHKIYHLNHSKCTF